MFKFLSLCYSVLHLLLLFVPVRPTLFVEDSLATEAPLTLFQGSLVDPVC